MRSARLSRRWSDHDRYFGPFTFAVGGSYRPIAAILSSGSRGDDEGGCNVRLSAFGATVICEIPQIVQPDRKWVDTSHYGWSDNPAGGYWDENPREFGFSLSEGFLQIFRGARTMDSSTDRSKGYFLPWKQWRCVANRLYGADGSFQGDVDNSFLDGRSWERRQKMEDETPKARFAFLDYDGAENHVVTHIQEWEWRLGEGWFKWIGYLIPKKRRRSLMLNFAEEVGREKGSWKGGLVGTSIDMLPGEAAEAAFRRYCGQDHRSKSGKYRIRFVGKLADANQ